MFRGPPVRVRARHTTHVCADVCAALRDLTLAEMLVGFAYLCAMGIFATVYTVYLPRPMIRFSLYLMEELTKHVRTHE